jgi:1-phosphofructokinase
VRIIFTSFSRASGEQAVILTVTPNTGLDRVIFLRDFQWGKTIRAEESAWGMGGKATDASFVLGELGESNLAMGFAAGETGERMVQALRKHPATQCDFVPVQGETRTNYILIDRARSAQSTVAVAGLQVNPQQVEDLKRRFLTALPEASCVVIGGSLPEGVPADFHAQLVARARCAGVPVILDASGDALKQGVAAMPSVVKPNRDELEFLAGHLLVDDQEVLAATRELICKGVELVVATLGARGLWAVSARETLFAPPLPIEPVNTAGAGDALVAGLARGIAHGSPWREGLRWGIAAAAAVCLTPGTAVCRLADVQRLLEQVQIQQF